MLARDKGAAKKTVVTPIQRKVKAAVDKGWVNITDLSDSLERITPEEELGSVRTSRSGLSPLDCLMVVLPMDLLWLMFEWFAAEFSCRRVAAESGTQRSVFRRFTFHEFGVLLAFAFVLPCAFKASSWANLWLLLSGAGIVIKCGEATLAKNRIKEFRRAGGCVAPSTFLALVEVALHNNLRPSTKSVVDESLPRVTHREVNPMLKVLVAIPRKPSGCGWLIYMVMCVFEMTGLPFTFGFEPVDVSNRPSPGQALLRLARRRFREGEGHHVHLIADGAFSAADLRQLLTESGAVTKRAAIDLTLSCNANWDKDLCLQAPGQLLPCVPYDLRCRQGDRSGLSGPWQGHPRPQCYSLEFCLATPRGGSTTSRAAGSAAAPLHQGLRQRHAEAPAPGLEALGR